MLMSNAEVVWSKSQPGDLAGKEVKSAVAAIDNLTSTDNNVPEHVRALADSIVVELYAYEAQMHLAQSHPANAVVAFRRALVRAQAAPGLADRTRQLTDALTSAQTASGDGKNAPATYDEAVKQAETASDTASIRHFLVQKAILCSELREYDEVVNINLRILEIDKRSGVTGNELGTELRLSRAYGKIDGNKAFAHATRAYKLAEQTESDRSLLVACDYLIRSYQTTADYDQVKTMLDQAMVITNNRGIPAEKARIHDRFGKFYMSDDKFDEADRQFQLGLEALGRKVPADNPSTGNAKYNFYLAELLLDMGQCFRKQGDTASALTHLNECEQLLKVNPDLQVHPWADLGELYLEMGRVSNAATYGKRALENAESENDPDLERLASGLLYRVYKRQGDPEKALAMHERFMAASMPKEGENDKLELQRTQLTMTFSEKQLQDSLFSARKAAALISDNEITKTRTRYLIIGGILLFLAGAMVALFDRRRRMARFDREAAQLETQALRSQMNPHFIFNALNSINAFVQKNEPDKAASFLSRFARLMRLVLENSRQTEVPLKDDLEALDAYLHLERTRTGEKFDYRIQVAADIDPEDVMVPPLVAQPFVENAIWHGMSGKEEKGMITLSVSRKGDQLLFAIEDDGVGRSSPKRMASMGESDPHDAPTKKTSLGTAITKARLDLVRQQKGKAAGFIYVDLPQGTRVELTLPFSTAA